MPEYLAPGVYVEETSFRSKSIEGVGTSTCGFVGQTLKGPVPDSTRPESSDNTPELITSFADFERTFGGLGDLDFGDGVTMTNYLAHAVQAFFNEGGGRLYVVRVFAPSGGTRGTGLASVELAAPGADGNDVIRVVARFPGRVGEGTVSLNLIRQNAVKRTIEVAPIGTSLRVTASDGQETFYVKQTPTGWFDLDGAVDQALESFTALTSPTASPGDNAEFLHLNVTTIDGDDNIETYEQLGFAPGHPRWLGSVLAVQPTRRREFLENLFGVEVGSNVDARSLLTALLGTSDSDTIELSSGNDGSVATTTVFEEALDQLAKLEDVSIVAAPGSSSSTYSATDQQGVRNALITHAEGTRAYRIAVLDTAEDLMTSGAKTTREVIDSKYAALYYPWVVVPNPLFRQGAANIAREIKLPPSGFVCGIYARNDVQRGVHKAPANEVVRTALRFESDINFAQQQVLNPLGVNCLRFFPGRGYRVWGARTASSDPEFKYVSDRRYFNYLESSIDRGTQWVVFEPNGDKLWTNVRQTVSSFLFNEWKSDALLGRTPEEAYFVRCDRSTMTQNDLDNGRLICLIGVALLKPAEFVIFRIGQKTVDARE